MEKALAYMRVSTDGQGIDGFGMAAQDRDVARFEQTFGVTVVERVYEVESGKNNNRPKLKWAARYCKKHGLILLIAKIDRLGRDAFHIAELISSGIEIKAADKPFATKLELLEEACKAQRVGEDISRRTKEGIQEKLRRGEPMGENAKVLALRNRYLSERYARRMDRKFEKYRAEGFTTERQLMKTLKIRGAQNYRNKKRWSASMVHDLLIKIKQLSQMETQDSFKILRRFIACFTQSEEQAEGILKEHYISIVTEASKGKGGFLEDFTLMLKRVREIALKAIQDKTLPEKCWTERAAFFPLSSAMSENHKEAFCLRFYRDMTEAEIAEKLRLTVKQIQILLQQALHDVSTHSIIKIDRIATV